MADAQDDAAITRSRQSHAMRRAGVHSVMTRLAYAAMAMGVITATIAAASGASAAPANLAYSTYYGGPGNDMAYMAATAPAGGAYVTGFLTTRTTIEGYVSLYTSAGKVTWSTILTGSGSVVPYYIRADAADVYVVGVTSAANLPGRTNRDPAGSSNTAFITLFNPTTGAIVSSTYLGGTGFSAANVNAIDPNTGNVDVGLSTSSQTEIMSLDPTGTHVHWSTLLGGTGASTHPYGLQTDRSGNVVVTTLTNSTHYPLLNAQQSTYGGGSDDTGVTEYSPAGQMRWSTYLGGNALDRPNGVDVDPQGNVYVAGRTYSANFPLAHALYSTNPVGNAAYVTSYTSTGVIRYSTYVGGQSGASWFGGITVGADGSAWVGGGSGSSSLPVVGGAAYVRKRGGYAYVAEIAPGDTAVTYATYLGGSATEGVSGLILGSSGLWVFGRTSSTNFPVVHPSQAANAGGFDAWIALMSSPP